MSKINDGGPAFPEAIAVGPAGDVYPGYSGMTIRDWFAGQALAGLLAEPQPDDGEPELGLGITYAGNAARAAYRLADAMLKAREASDVS